MIDVFYHGILSRAHSVTAGIYTGREGTKYLPALTARYCMEAQPGHMRPKRGDGEGDCEWEFPPREGKN